MLRTFRSLLCHYQRSIAYFITCQSTIYFIFSFLPFISCLSQLFPSSSVTARDCSKKFTHSNILIQLYSSKVLTFSLSQSSFTETRQVSPVSPYSLHNNIVTARPWSCKCSSGDSKFLRKVGYVYNFTEPKYTECLSIVHCTVASGSHNATASNRSVRLRQYAAVHRQEMSRYRRKLQQP
jgi:hypothetical protein